MRWASAAFLNMASKMASRDFNTRHGFSGVERRRRLSHLPIMLPLITREKPSAPFVSNIIQSLTLIRTIVRSGRGPFRCGAGRQHCGCEKCNYQSSHKFDPVLRCPNAGEHDKGPTLVQAKVTAVVMGDAKGRGSNLSWACSG